MPLETHTRINSIGSCLTKFVLLSKNPNPTDETNTASSTAKAFYRMPWGGVCATIQNPNVSMRCQPQTHSCSCQSRRGQRDCDNIIDVLNQFDAGSARMALRWCRGSPSSPLFATTLFWFVSICVPGDLLLNRPTSTLGIMVEYQMHCSVVGEACLQPQNRCYYVVILFLQLHSKRSTSFNTATYRWIPSIIHIDIRGSAAKIRDDDEIERVS